MNIPVIYDNLIKETNRNYIEQQSWNAMEWLVSNHWLMLHHMQILHSKTSITSISLLSAQPQHCCCHHHDHQCHQKDWAPLLSWPFDTGMYHTYLYSPAIAIIIPPENDRWHSIIICPIICQISQLENQDIQTLFLGPGLLFDGAVIQKSGAPISCYSFPYRNRKIVPWQKEHILSIFPLQFWGQGQLQEVLTLCSWRIS